MELRECLFPITGRKLMSASGRSDLSRYDGRYEIVFETTTAGITIQSPQLDVNTVAAGGGSRLFYRNSLFTVGPESAGAHVSALPPSQFNSLV